MLPRILLTLLRHIKLTLACVVAGIVVIVILTSGSSAPNSTQQFNPAPKPGPVITHPVPAPPAALNSPSNPSHKTKRSTFHSHKNSSGPPVKSPPAAVAQETPSQDALRSGAPVTGILPVSKAGVTIAVIDRAPNGQFVIQISYKRSKAAAIKSWQKLLRNTHDLGSQYLTIYKKG